MAEGTIRTETHYYPREEINAMTTFYNGKRCIVTHDMAQWAYMLDAALETSAVRLKWMLDRHLRQNRHPKHAAEVRENVVPLSPTQHVEMDSYPPFATLVLHEDLVARTLAFEIELQMWRRAEIEAGRGDPGRPPYECVFEVHGITRHRWHCADGSNPFLRPFAGVFGPADCPGVYPSSGNPFPVLNTLLSIPFSILHGIARLGCMVPLSEYQCALLAMGHKIIQLWSWDPPTTVNPSTSCTADAIQARSPAPLPIGHTSRDNTTFESMRAQITHRPSNLTTVSRPITATSTPNASIYELPSSEVLVGKPPSVSWDRSIINSLGESWELASEPSKGSFDRQDAKSPTQPLSPSEITSWLNAVTIDDQKLPPITHDSYERGVMGSMSVKFERHLDD